MTKRKTISQNTPEPSKKPKTVLLEEYFNFKSYSKEIMTNLMMERLGEELLQFVSSDEGTLKIKQFLAMRGISERDWNRWTTAYESLKRAHEQALMILGNRREIGGLRRDFDAGQVNFMMPLYDKDHKDMLEYREGLKQKNEDKEGKTIVVTMPVYGKKDGE